MKNAYITKTSTIIFDDGACINFSIAYKESENKIIDTKIAFNSFSEMRLLNDVLGVADLEHLVGAPIRVGIEDNKVISIGNFYDDERVINLSFVEEKPDETENDNDNEEIKET